MRNFVMLKLKILTHLTALFIVNFIAKVKMFGNKSTNFFKVHTFYEFIIKHFIE